jgi:hypothetical protein
MVLGLWDGRLRRAAALVIVEQTFDNNLPSNETIICVVGVVYFHGVRLDGACASVRWVCGFENGWNGGTRAATRATLIFVHMLRTYPSLMMHAASQRRRDEQVTKRWA